MLKQLEYTGKKFALVLIRLYSLFLRHILVIEGCRYKPTCSSYMRLAILYNGLLAGIYQGTKRILRCHPWVDPKTPLYDPIPTKKDNLNGIR